MVYIMHSQWYFGILHLKIVQLLCVDLLLQVKPILKRLAQLVANIFG